jgi:hypothetical protein
MPPLSKPQRAQLQATLASQLSSGPEMLAHRFILSKYARNSASSAFSRRSDATRSVVSIAIANSERQCPPFGIVGV